METPLTQAEILAAATGLDSSVKALESPAPGVFDSPQLETQFTSPIRPGLNGLVVMRYPTFGDTLRIESIAGNSGPVHEAFATFLICIEKAPETWWYLPEGSTVPTLNLEKFPDSEALLDLWQKFLLWRTTFRGGGVR